MDSDFLSTPLGSLNLNESYDSLAFLDSSFKSNVSTDDTVFSDTEENSSSGESVSELDPTKNFIGPKLNLKWIIFSDEKKACLWSDKSAHFFLMTQN